MKNLLTVIKEISSLHPSINFVGDGDVFALNSITEIQYPAIWVDIDNMSTDLEDLKTTYKIYYIDRLLNDKENELEIQSDSAYILNDIIIKLSDYYSFNTPVNIVPFKQKFTDSCAGGYMSIIIRECLKGVGIVDIIQPTSPNCLPADYVCYNGKTLKEILDEGTGGTTDHSELTEESRALPAQHPIGAISDLTEELVALREAVRAGVGAALTLVADPTPQTIQTVETDNSYAVQFPSTDTTIMDFELVGDPCTHMIHAKRAGRYFFASNIRINKTVGAPRTIYLSVRNEITGEVVTPYPRIITLGTGIGVFAVPTQTIPIDVAADTRLVLTAYASDTGCEFALLETNFYTAAGGGSGLWKQNEVAELILPSDITMQGKTLTNALDTQITALKSDAETGGELPSSIYDWFKSVYATLVDKSVKSWIAGLVTIVKSLTERVDKLEDNYILKYVVPVDTTAINLTTDRYGNALNLTDITIIADIQFTGPSGMHLRINNIIGEGYRNYNLDPNANIAYRNRFWIESSTNFILQKAVIDLFIVSNEVILTSKIRGETATPTYASGIRGVSNSVGMNINAITTLNIFSNNVASLIKAGSVILIKKR